VQTAAKTETVNLAQLAELLKIDESTAKSDVVESLPEWRRGRDGRLPRPLPEFIRDLRGTGIERRWDRKAAEVFADGPRRLAGRPRGPRPTVYTLDEVLGAADPPTRMADLADALGKATGTDVNLRTAQRLLRLRRRDALAAIVAEVGAGQPDVARQRLHSAVAFPLPDVAWYPLWREATSAEV
jgi:hypothetical protein